jgi:hypothetical protein
MKTDELEQAVEERVRPLVDQSQRQADTVDRSGRREGSDRVAAADTQVSPVRRRCEWNEDAQSAADLLSHGGSEPLEQEPCLVQHLAPTAELRLRQRAAGRHAETVPEGISVIDEEAYPIVRELAKGMPTTTVPWCSDARRVAFQVNVQAVAHPNYSHRFPAG